jgi:hypothetical protein
MISGYAQLLPATRPAQPTGDYLWATPPGQGCGCALCRQPVPDPAFPGLAQSARLNAEAAARRREWVRLNGVTEGGARGQ